MNIIQARAVNVFLDGCGKRYTFKVPDGVKIEKDALLLAQKNGGKNGTQVVRAATDSIEVTDEVLNMIMDGKKVISSVIGVYELKKFEEPKEEPEVDWSKVAVDTPILVRNEKDRVWQKRHFAKYKDGDVYSFVDGCTSWTVEAKVRWDYAKLAEVEK